MISKIKFKKNIIIILVIVFLIAISFICFGELGTNREMPKRSIYVNNMI